MQLIQGPALSALSYTRPISRVQPQPVPSSVADGAQAAQRAGQAGRVVLDKVDLSDAAKALLEEIDGKFAAPQFPGSRSAAKPGSS